MNPVAAPSWPDANQQLLSAELALLRLRLGGDAQDGDGALLAEQVRAAREAMPAPGALDRVCAEFGLSGFERELLLLCCGVELDARIADACGRRLGAPGRANATFGLALATLDGPHWSALTPSRPLRRWRLLDVDAGSRLADSPLRVDERVLHFIAGINEPDRRVLPLLRPLMVPNLMSGSHRRIAEGIVAALRARDLPAAIVLEGNDAHGRKDVFAAVCAAEGHAALSVSLDELPASAFELDAVAVLLGRECRLLGAWVVIESSQPFPDAGLDRMAAHLPPVLFLSGELPTRIARFASRWTIDKPEPVEQKLLWQQALGDRAARLNGSLDGLSDQFSLSAGNIDAISSRIGADAADAGIASELWQSCRQSGRGRLEGLAQRIEPASCWEDLVLPSAQLDSLRQIAAHLRQRARVYEEWGFGSTNRRSLGLSTLFCGESGTGKTMAAEVIANDLDLDLFRIDLSAVVSKYIGETEKNLSRVFEAAEDSGAILLFDEADALFGKRGEVKDSHDRYANMEVSYLLQRMESYRGLAILTSNMRASLDRAFQRRLRFIIQFPFPDAALREAIWRRAFPPQAPLHGLDYVRLARLSLPGGSIRNIALNAAFLAADGRQAIGMAHLLRAAQSEGSKADRPLSEAETRGWA